MQAAGFGQALDLHDHHAAGIMRRHGDRLRFQGQRLALHADVAERVRGGAADDADIDREAFVEQYFLAVEGYEFDEVFGGAGVDLAAAVARIDERAEADAGEMRRAVRGDVAEQVGDDALRQVIALDLVGDR